MKKNTTSTKRRTRKSPWARHQLLRLLDQEGDALDLYALNEAFKELSLASLFVESVPVNSNKRAGYVYLIKTDNRIYKIGMSIRAQNRLAAIQTTAPNQCEIVRAIKTSDRYHLEGLLHSRYADKRMYGEWFRLAEHDVAWICSLPDEM